MNVVNDGENLFQQLFCEVEMYRVSQNFVLNFKKLNFLSKVDKLKFSNFDMVMLDF